MLNKGFKRKKLPVVLGAVNAYEKLNLSKLVHMLFYNVLGFSPIEEYLAVTFLQNIKKIGGRQLLVDSDKNAVRAENRKINIYPFIAVFADAGNVRAAYAAACKLRAERVNIFVKAVVGNALHLPVFLEFKSNIVTCLRFCNFKHFAQGTEFCNIVHNSLCHDFPPFSFFPSEACSPLR